MHHDWLTASWFVLIAVLWTGYFFLEGFDFGVGILLPVIGRDDGQRRVGVNSIGPFLDANEGWLIVAGGATFAAFPQWYATQFSGFYPPPFPLTVAPTTRGVDEPWPGAPPGRLRSPGGASWCAPTSPPGEPGRGGWCRRSSRWRQWGR